MLLFCPNCVTVKSIKLTLPESAYVILLLPVTILLPLQFSTPPSWGEVSSTRSDKVLLVSASVPVPVGIVWVLSVPVTSTPSAVVSNFLMSLW